MFNTFLFKYIGTDRECSRVLVAAGTRGFCFCTLKNSKWRLFRKEAQVNLFFFK